MSLTDIYAQAWQAIICPKHSKHRPAALGPFQQQQHGRIVRRQDLRLRNKNGKIIEGFVFYLAAEPKYTARPHDFVLYLHGNGGSKLDAIELSKCCAKYQIAVGAFDFAGCGNSDSDYLTYGIKEADDVKMFVDEACRILGSVGTISLWGRSMGAATAIVFAERYPGLIHNLVLDSPFRKLAGVVQRAACDRVNNIPQAIVNMFMFFVKNKVEAELNLNTKLFSIDYLDIFRKIMPEISVLVFFSHNDTIVPTEQVLEFYYTHKGYKETCEILEGHDEDRKPAVYEEGVKWLKMARTSRGKRMKMMLSEDQVTRAAKVFRWPTAGCCDGDGCY